MINVAYPLNADDRLIPISESCTLAGGVSKTTLWRWEKAGKFPKRIALASNKSVHRLSEIMAWMDELSVRRQVA